MACRVIGNRPARSVAVAGPAVASAARMPRRVGSASAVKTSCATASESGLTIEVTDQFTEFAGPALDIAPVGLVVIPGVLQLREPGFDHGQRGAGASRFQGELHPGASWIVVGQAIQTPGVGEDVRRLDPLDHQGRAVTAVPDELRLAANAQVDLRAVAEPGAKAFGRGQLPDPFRWVGQFKS